MLYSIVVLVCNKSYLLPITFLLLMIGLLYTLRFWFTLMPIVLTFIREMCGCTLKTMHQQQIMHIGSIRTRKMRPRDFLVDRSVLLDILLYLSVVAISLLFINCSVSGLDISNRRGEATNTYTRTNRYGNTLSKNKIKVSVAVVLPKSTFKSRQYKKQIKTAAESLKDVTFEKSGFELSPYLVMMERIPTPTEVLGKICDQFLANNTSAVFYLTNDENYGRYSVASQYFIQLAQYVQIPIISWNADNSAYEQGTAESLQLQLAPTIKHQVRAILSLLERYGWHTFSIVTGQIAGHRNFEQVIHVR